MLDSHRWQTLLDDVARLASRRTPLPDFARDVIERISQSGCVSWVALWCQESQEAAECQIAGTPASLPGSVPEESIRQQARSEARVTQQPVWIASRSVPWTSSGVACLAGSLVVPVPAAREFVCTWEFLGIAAEGQAELAELRSALEAVATLTVDQLREAELARLEDQHQTLCRWMHLCATALRTTDGQQALNLLAEETRSLAACDRAWIVEIWNGASAAVAVSSAAHVERRSALAQSLERLVDSLTLAHRRGGASIAGLDLLSLADPQRRHSYFQLSGCRELVVLPLFRDPAALQAEWAGLLVCENFQQRLLPPPPTWKLWQQCAGGFLLGLQRTHRPLWKRLWHLEGPAWRQLVAGRRALWWWGVGLMLLCPWPYRVAAEGELRPLDEVRLFAPDDAVVTEVMVGHGATVVPGESLLQLRSSRLDLERERIEGELRAARERLAGVESNRLGGESSRNDFPTGSPTGLSGEEAGLREQVASLERQAESIARQLSELRIRAPAAGKVLTWDPSPRLRDRPVQRGQVLLELGSGTTGWRLDLWVAGRRARELSVAPPGGGPEVEFRRLAVPGDRGRARLSAVGAAADVDPSGVPGVRVEALIEASPATADFRPGEAVRARIACGWRAAVFVMLPDLFDTCRRWLPW